jgi:hypothetical protein
MAVYRLVFSFAKRSGYAIAEGHTGYSHQSNMPNATFNAALHMVSADNLTVAQSAWAGGVYLYLPPVHDDIL